MLHIQKQQKIKKIKIIKIWNYEKSKENTTFKLKSQVKTNL